MTTSPVCGNLKAELNGRTYRARPEAEDHLGHLPPSQQLLAGSSPGSDVDRAIIN